MGVDLNAPMLSVARSLDPVPGACIRWRSGDAEDLPFLDVSFDAVLCHQGFQFFPDRAKAALEIARVLRPRGRLALSVWCGPDRNPLADALIAVLESTARPAFSRAIRWPFSVQNRREITAPIALAGLRVLMAETSRLLAYAVNAAEFLNGLLRAMPFGSELHGPAMEAVVRDTIAALGAYVRRGDCECRGKLRRSSPCGRARVFIKTGGAPNPSKDTATRALPLAVESGMSLFHPVHSRPFGLGGIAPPCRLTLPQLPGARWSSGRITRIRGRNRPLLDPDKGSPGNPGSESGVRTASSSSR